MDTQRRENKSLLRNWGWCTFVFAEKDELVEEQDQGEAKTWTS
jgi:hypothetical protein